MTDVKMMPKDRDKNVILKVISVRDVCVVLTYTISPNVDGKQGIIPIFMF